MRSGPHTWSRTTCSATVSNVRLPTTPLEFWPERRLARRLLPCASSVRMMHAASAADPGQSRTIKMKTFTFVRAAQAALIAAATCGPSTAVLADIKDYKFELVDQSVQTGSDKM